MLRAILTAIVALVLISYPIFVYWGLTHVQPRVIALAMLVVVALRLALIQKQRAKGPVVAGISIALAAFATSLICAAINSPLALLLTPVAINAALLLVFGFSLLRPPSIAEQFAQRNYDEVPPEVSAYCRRVTIVWIIFFVLNGSTSAILAFYGSQKSWALYTGMISYILIGIIAGVEFMIRRQKQREMPPQTTP